MDIDDIRFRIAAARRMLYREGCDSTVGGHVSARAGAEDAFWVTGFEYFDQTTPDGVCRLGFDLEVREGEMDLSPAVGFHARIYETRPDVEAIVHLHSHFVSVLSSTGRPLGMYDVAAVLFHDDQALYADDGVKSHLAVVDALGAKRVVLMKNHGAIVASQSLEQATIEAIALEQSARRHLACEAAGGTEIAEAEVVAGKAAYQKHYLPQMWDANLARLERSDPDLFVGVLR
ncbi:class II aldolase/adducin family protein [Iamia majanohamensis]|uniref:Class II aldolase/adducin family protein n=1 Tax=Iamia majanohamensis TaxID=467976 RepID=A0AAF0BT03_9ACTN|nr:class II aldolase/adducin family protein [Iamia majanohamensis]WCO66112.1 class II aldolase/adducin family protein [Iamia majanohamensis]